MTKQIKIDSCAECIYPKRRDGFKGAWCGHPLSQQKAISVSTYQINKTIHPDCPLDDMPDIEDIKNRAFNEGVSFASEN